MSESGARGVRAQRGKGHEVLPRELLQPDAQVMSARALGLLVHMLSRPDGWRFSAERLAATFTEGRVAIERALNELEALGYLDRRKVRGPGGRFVWAWIYGVSPADVAAGMDAALAVLDSRTEAAG